MRPGTPDLATERERQLPIARANQTTSLTILFPTVAAKVFQQTGLLQHVS